MRPRIPRPEDAQDLLWAVDQVRKVRRALEEASVRRPQVSQRVRHSQETTLSVFSHENEDEMKRSSTVTAGLTLGLRTQIHTLHPAKETPPQNPDLLSSTPHLLLLVPATPPSAPPGHLMHLKDQVHHMLS